MAGALTIAALAALPSDSQARTRQKSPATANAQTDSKVRKLEDSDYRDLEIIRSHEGRTVLEACKGNGLFLVVVDQNNNAILAEVGMGPCLQRHVDSGFRTTELYESIPVSGAAMPVADLRPLAEERAGEAPRSRTDRDGLKGERNGERNAERNFDERARGRGSLERADRNDELPRPRGFSERAENRGEQPSRPRPFAERGDEPPRSRAFSERNDEPSRPRPFAERNDERTRVRSFGETGDRNGEDALRRRPPAERGEGKGEERPRPFAESGSRRDEPSRSRLGDDRPARTADEPTRVRPFSERLTDSETPRTFRDREGPRLGGDGPRLGGEGTRSGPAERSLPPGGGRDRLGDGDPPRFSGRSGDVKDREGPLERSRESSTLRSRSDDFGERESRGRLSERRNGTRLEADEIPVKMCARGFSQVTILDDKPPRMLVEGCRGDTRYRLALDRNGEIVDQESLGPCRSRVFGIGLDELYGAMRRLFRGGERGGDTETIGGSAGAKS